MERILPFAHALLQSCLDPKDIAVDFTCGNGNDTIFLAKCCPQGNVLAFDIQPAAIQQTEKNLKQESLSNITTILDSHCNAHRYFSAPIGGGIFNLGYLPGGDKKIITKKDSSILAIEHTLPFLKVGGILVIVCYIGHSGGAEEALALDTFCQSLEGKRFSVLKYAFINQSACPYILAIQKKSK